MKIKNIIITISAAIVFTACGSEKEKAQNMEKIYAEEGVPVKVEEVKQGDFRMLFNYNATLSGYQETNAYAMVGDKVEQVFAKVGDYVKKDQILATFPSDNPSTQYYQAKAAYDNAVTSYERYQKLYESGGISQQTLDNIKTQLEVAKANYNSVGQMVKVKAPMSGYITKVEALVTDNVKKEQLLFTIADTRKLKAKIDVAENEISSVKKGLSVKAEWNGNLLTGRITELDVAMNPYTKSFMAAAEFDNPGNKIPAGVTAKITIEAGIKSNAIVVERKNLIREDENFFVYLTDGNKAIRKQVKLGSTKDLYVELVDGVKQGDKLIVEGILNLEDQIKVKIIK